MRRLIVWLDEFSSAREITAQNAFQPLRLLPLSTVITRKIMAAIHSRNHIPESELEEPPARMKKYTITMLLSNACKALE
jgi:hypothetical protein